MGFLAAVMAVCLLAEGLSSACGCDLFSLISLVTFYSLPFQLTFLSAFPFILSSCPCLTTWKFSTCATWQRSQHPLPLRTACLCSGNSPINEAGSLDAPTSFQGSACTNCTGCSEQQETEMPNIGRSWCGKAWIQRWRRWKKGRRWRMRQGWPKPWWD